MSALRFAVTTALVLLSASASAQQIRTYVENPGGANTLVYGLPVPLPIESLTPVDGFRSYASLDARLQSLALESDDLAAHQVGTTFAGRPLWAYVVSDENDEDVEGRPEAAFFINASTHAREWGTPEVSVGTIERLIADAGDGALGRWLLDNTRLVIIPVHNVDGRLQTERFPSQVIIGQDPTDADTWPRDGRMRRKNMRGADEVLTTFGDHLNGVDLNRNHPPFWNTSNSSSPDPRNLVFHGSGPHSEPENQALLNAAMLAPASRIRLGIDVHTFSQVFFSSNTARTRLNEIQRLLIGRIASNQLELSGRLYQDRPDPPNVGIGAAADYFAYQWLVPSWTLELEPINDTRPYGGTALSHSGFILPASEARRVRESWAESHVVAFYYMAGPPHLARVRVFDADSDALRLETRWRYDAASARRVREHSGAASLEPGGRYRIELAFSKPMRRRGPDGNFAAFRALFALQRDPVVTLHGDGGAIALSTTGGDWIDDPARSLRYRNDTYAFEFTAPEAIDDYTLEVSARDMVGHELDSDPATPMDWSSGAWAAYEDSQGVAGDVGGKDSSTVLGVASGSLTVATLLDDPRIVGEGDRIDLRFELGAAQGERVTVQWVPPGGDSSSAPPAVAWEPGETGLRTLQVPITEDLEVQGERVQALQLVEFVGAQSRSSPTVELRVLDNDRADARVRRAYDSSTLAEGWTASASEDAGVHLVLDGPIAYTLPTSTNATPGQALAVVTSRLTLHGNGSTLRSSDDPPVRSVLSVAETGDLSIDRVDLDLSPSALPFARSLGRMELSRARVGAEDRVGGELVASEGELVVRRTAVLDAHFETVLWVQAGTLRVSSATIGAVESFYLITGADAESVDIDSATMVENSMDARPIGGFGDGMPRFGHTVLRNVDVSNTVSPPVLQNCSSAGSSIGFNIENYTTCGFDQAGDRSGFDLGTLVFDDALGGYAPVGAAIDGGATASQAEATGCGPVDQRGAPRPQTLTPGAEPRCDIGAIELGVNPYRGIWAPTRAGHGIDLQTAGNVLLLAWYTYGDDGQPTAYQAAAPLTGPHWEAPLLQPRRDPQSGAVAQTPVGTVSLDFESDTVATLGWRFDARGVDGSERVEASLFAPGEPRFEITGLWYPPADAGYGATISRRGEVTALGLYYYDAAGNVRWALGAGNAADAVSLSMSSYTGFCPDCDPAAMPVQSQSAGTVLAHFLTPASAWIETALTYPGSAGGNWNRSGDFVPLNDPVDNGLTLGTR